MSWWRKRVENSLTTKEHLCSGTRDDCGLQEKLEVHPDQARKFAANCVRVNISRKGIATFGSRTSYRLSSSAYYTVTTPRRETDKLERTSLLTLQKWRRSTSFYQRLKYLSCPGPARYQSKITTSHRIFGGGSGHLQIISDRSMVQSCPSQDYHRSGAPGK